VNQRYSLALNATASYTRAMSTLSRAVRSLACIALLVQTPLQPVLAQAPGATGSNNNAPVHQLEADSQEPWLYKNSDVPHDKDWHFGTLANGLRYAVRKNGVPPGQVSIRIRADVGSLYETDSERGYAHLLEHLVFRQSKYIPEGTAIATFQRLGASFGSDTNAQTTPTETVFQFDLPDATTASMDESFKLLSGMITAPTLSADDIKQDLPIVLAEMRERGGASKRVQDAIQETFYAGQPLAERAPIGTVKTLEAATPQSVRAFYERWYRPETVTVIVAGDADPAVLESYVKKWFGDWHVPGKVTPAPSFGDPVAPKGADPANPVGLTRVLVEPDLPPTIMYAILRPWRQKNDTIVYNQGLMIDGIAQGIINHRLQKKAQSSGATFLDAQVDQEDTSRSADATFVTITPLEDKDWKSAVHDVRAVIADALATPPSQEEIDREVADLDVGFQVPVEQRTILPGSKLADDLVNALDIRETVAAPDAVLKIFRDSKPLFTPEAVLEHTRKLFNGTVTRGLFVSSQPEMATAAQVREALAEPVKPDTSVRLVGPAVSFDKLPAIGTPAKPISDKPSGLLDIEQLDFANGVKALLWPVKEEPGRVMVKVRFGGGIKDTAPKDVPYLSLGDNALVSSGMATLDQEALGRIATGRKLGFEFDEDDANFTFSAETRTADLADQLYLFAAKLDLPEWDKSPFLRAKAAARIQYDGYSSSPQGVLNRDLKFYQRAQDPRYRTPDPAEIAKATPEGFKAYWSKQLATGPVEVQIYGDFDKPAAIAALEKTFGALKPRLAQGQEAAIREPAATDKPVVLTHRGDADQAAAVISWPTGGGSPGITESRQLEILTQVFSNRLLDALREKMGASYSPYVFSSWPVDMKTGGSITAIAQVKPAAVPEFFHIADQIAQNLVDQPPSADELARVTEPLKQQITRAASSSAFFMSQLEGATYDPSRFAALNTVLFDYTRTTPAKMQELAARYLGKDHSWRLEVMPQSKVAGTTGK